MCVSLGVMVAWGAVLAVANPFVRFPAWSPLLGMGAVSWMLIVHTLRVYYYLRWKRSARSP